MAESYNFSDSTRRNCGGDEYCSPQNVVDMILPYVKKGGYKNIWCPFDKEESYYVQTFKRLGYKVSYGHIETGQDFFKYNEPQGEIVVSNPPFSKRDMIFRRLFDMNIPFALVMNLNGLFDNRTRADMFRENGIQLLIPHGRMKFILQGEQKNSPNFQSVYVCHNLLDQELVFTEDYF